VLPSVPDEDKIGQTRKLTAYVKDKMGFEPKGFWLAERVWEPSLPSVLAAAGVEYSVVDASHFKSAGLTDRELLGYYLTEDQGAVVRMFSGSKRLRYLIPFADPSETLRYFRDCASDAEGTLLVFADDGEKFGVWPGTHSLCYKEKWLEKFFKALEGNSEWLNVVTFSEYLRRRRPLGWVFLPTASYAEMMEWCLPVEAQLKYQALLKKLKEKGELGEYEGFLKGGFWRNFLSRYPESNWMHKRMLFARKLVLQAAGQDIPEGPREKALNEIWRAQCNCAYWHGVFGGLYLPHLREAIYKHIIRAENVLSEAHGRAMSLAELSGEESRVLRTDIDGDGDDEVVLSNRRVAFYVVPARGGTVVEIDHRSAEVNLLNNLARRREAYHEQMKRQRREAQKETVASIHEAVVAKEENLDKFLFHDRFPRVCLIDHFLPPDSSLREMVECSYREAGTFAQARYAEGAATGPKKDGGLVLSSSGSVRLAGEELGAMVEKSLVVPDDGAALAVSYVVSFDRALSAGLMFAPELNLHFSSPDSASAEVDANPSVETKLSLSRPTESHGFSALRVHDKHFGFTLVLRAEGASTLWQFPVETVSLSEGGLERVYQCSCVIPVWSLEPGVRTKKLRIDLALKD